jgi:hypothetical protein
MPASCLTHDASNPFVILEEKHKHTLPPSGNNFMFEAIVIHLIFTFMNSAYMNSHVESVIKHVREYTKTSPGALPCAEILTKYGHRSKDLRVIWQPPCSHF